MLDDNDIQKLSQVFATKDQLRDMFKENNKKLLNDFSDVFVTKTDLEDFKEEYREEFSKVLNPIDKSVDEKNAEAQEKTMLDSKIKRHEKWITQIAKKVDLKLES